MNWPILVVLGLLILSVGYRLWMRRGVANVSVHEIKSRMGAKDKMFIVDVREPHEFKAGHLAGAVNIPLGELPKRAEGLKRDEEIILVCASGSRSLSAYQRLKAMGFSEVRNLEGGMRRWAWDTVK